MSYAAGEGKLLLERGEGAASNGGGEELGKRVLGKIRSRKTRRPALMKP